MATYVIGDLQGCFKPLQNLLSLIGFNINRDSLIFCGDLVNRGPESLATLRLVKSLVEKGVAQTVLGNHDLHLLAVMAGFGYLKYGDTLNEILAAKDHHLLQQWIKRQPLSITLKNTSSDCTETQITPVTTCWISHAGLYPQWNVKQATELGEEVEEVLRSKHTHILLSQLYGNTPERWDQRLQNADRWRFIVNAFTRMRFVSTSGDLLLKIKTSPAENPSLSNTIQPWFNLLAPEKTRNKRFFFGHWATLKGQCDHPSIEATDTGCVWGGTLTAVNLHTLERYSVQNTSGHSTLKPAQKIQ